MLKTLFRALAVALLMVTVPLQGFAAVSAGICMALGHHDGAAAAHERHAQGGSWHAHDAGDSAHAHDHGASTAPGPDDAAAGGQTSEGSHCAPCVSCCGAAAIAPLPSMVLQERTVSALVPAPLVSFDGIAPQRLDRPPLAL